MPVGTGTSTLPLPEGSNITGSLRNYKDILRDYLQDWEYEDRLTTAISNTDTSIEVLDGSKFTADDIIWILDEAVRVSDATSNTLTIVRGWYSTTPLLYLSGTKVFKGNIWTDAQFGRWINESFHFVYPALYQRTTTTLTGSDTDYTYALPAAVTERSQIESVEAIGTDGLITKINNIQLTGEPPQLYLPAYLSAYTLQATYTYPFDELATDGAVTILPARAKGLPVYYAAARAMEQREALRSRYDAYATAQDERTTREGQNLATGSYYWKLFNSLLDSVKMPRRGHV